jgi:oligopeptide/dipeptide ABC transporter ATP-binding protein
MEPVLTVNALRKYYPVKSGALSGLMGRRRLYVRAVDGVDLEILQSETMGLVGESGSGKTTLGRCILLLEKPTSGQVSFAGVDITRLRGEDLRKMRKSIQIVFQNPSSSLDSRQRVKDILLEPLRAMGSGDGAAGSEIINATITSVGLNQDFLSRFPHELSGGQKQRVAIARSLVLNPKFLVLDEPTSALDASIQIQILNLLREIQERREMTYLFITHNISVVRYMADRIAVMYAGKIVELGPARKVLEEPLHPYTSALIASVPEPDPRRKIEMKPLRGEVPSMVNPPSGCRFNPRCPLAQRVCKEREPELRRLADGRLVACHLV